MNAKDVYEQVAVADDLATNPRMKPTRWRVGAIDPHMTRRSEAFLGIPLPRFNSSSLPWPIPSGSEALFHVRT